MKSQKGIGIVRLLIFVVAMTFFLGIATYVVVQDNGIYDREIKPLLEKSSNTNEVVSEK